MNPYKLKNVFEYLTSNNQLLKKKLKLGTSEIPIPPKRQDVIDVEVINRFTKANPRVDTTNLKPLSVKQSNVKKTENFAEGGRIGYKDGPKLTDFLNVQASGSKSGKQQIQGAPEGITSDKEIINAIITMDIPLTEKVNLIGDLQYGKFRDRIEYNDDEIFLDDPKSYRNRNIGLEYNRGGEGFSGSATVGDRGSEYNIRYKKSFADGGMLVQPNDDGSRPGYSGKYGPNIRKLTKSDSLEVQVVRGGTGGGKGGQKFYKTFNFDDYGGEAKTLKAAKEYRDSLPKIKKDTGKQSKGQPIGFKKETGGQSEIRKILKEIIKVGGKSFSNEDIRQLIDTGLFPDDDQFRKAVDVVKKEPEFKNLTFEKKPRPRLKTDPVSVLMAKTKERRNKKINILGSKDYEKELYKYKKEIQEALGLEKYKTSGSISGKPRELLPIEMGHQSSIKQLSLLKQKMRPEDLSPQNYEVNRKGVKKNKGGVQTLEDNLNKKFYPEQKKLYIKAKKFIDAGKTVPADLQNKIVSLNEDIQKFVDNTVKKYPLLKDRVNPITIDANDLTVKRGDNVFKQLGIGLVDQDLGDIKIGSMDDLTIKANLAEQTFREAVDAGLIDEKIGRQRLDKFLNVRDTEILKAEQKPIKNLIASFGGGTCSVFSGKKATLKADGGRIGLATGTPNIDDCFKSGSAVINSGKVPVDKADDFAQLLKRAGSIGRGIMKFGIIPEAMYVAADSLIRVGMGDTFTEAGLRASDYVLPGDQTKAAEISKVSRIFGDETGELVGRAIDYKNQLAKDTKFRRSKSKL